MKVYVIIEDDNGNLHQGAMDESKEIIVCNLVKCYPNNNFTKDIVEVIKKLNKNIEG